MARIQILELPTIYRENGPDETPFVLVVDQADEATANDFARNQDLATRIGARALLAFEDTIDIPANEITLTEATEGNVVRLRVEPDLTGFHEQVQVEIAKAQAELADALGQPRRA